MFNSDWEMAVTVVVSSPTPAFAHTYLSNFSFHSQSTSLNTHVISVSGSHVPKAHGLSCTTTKQGTHLRRPFTIMSAATKPAKSPAEEDWKIKRLFLLKNNKVRTVDVKEAFRLQQENGFVILDVRPAKEFKEAHPAGAINVQVYRLIKEWTAWDIARRAAFAFFGIFAGTEENPNFLEEVRSKLDKSSKIIVACSSGGTLRPSLNLPEGQQSRSLIAAYLLALDGYPNIFHLNGGLYAWFKEDLPVESEE